MILAIILLSIFGVITLSWGILVTTLASKASRQLQRYDEFFRDSIEDIEHSRSIFDQLVNKKEYLADNPDIVQIQQVFAVTLDVLTGYLNDGRQFTANIPQKKGKKEKEKEEK